MAVSASICYCFLDRLWQHQNSITFQVCIYLLYLCIYLLYLCIYLYYVSILYLCIYLFVLCIYLFILCIYLFILCIYLLYLCIYLYYVCIYLFSLFSLSDALVSVPPFAVKCTLADVQPVRSELCKGITPQLWTQKAISFFQAVTVNQKDLRMIVSY